MKVRRFLIMLALLMALSAPALVVLAEETGGEQPPWVEGKHMRGPTAMCADQQYLYLMIGKKLMKYSVNELKILKSVDLPIPAPTADVKSRDKENHPHGFGGPPPMGGAQMALSGDRSLIVMAGPRLYRYSTSDLSLQSSADLPKPEPPAQAAGSN